MPLASSILRFEELSASYRILLYYDSMTREVRMSRMVTLRLDEEVWRELREAAAAENRPLSNLIETAALSRIREQRFVDDAEMAEIFGNEKLLARMKKGSRQARRRQGRFVG